MTIDEAADILNSRCHHGHYGWLVDRGDVDCGIKNCFSHERYEAFEAIAIATLYVKGGNL